MANPNSMGDQFLGKINKIIDDNLDNESFSVTELAEHAGLSRSMLHRKLIKLTGISASDLIMEKRLIRAKELLDNNVATVSEIAYRVGFNSPSYFNKVFHKRFNLSPGDVRKNGAAHQNQQSIGEEQERPFSSHKSGRKVFIILSAIIAAGIGLYTLFTLTPPSEKSIAVLPLNNLTGHIDNDYFVDGLHDALIGELGQIGKLRVISRTSTLRYRDSQMLLKDIAKELGVNTIVEGSVTRAGDSLRILIQLIDVFPKERHIFAHEYHDGMHNVLTVQSSAVKDIAQKINIKLSKTEAQRLAKTRIVDPETYKAYLRGMYYLNQGTEESFEKGISFLQEAIKKDPGDPFAYAGLALGYSIIGHGQLNSEQAFLLAMSSAKKAIKLDPEIDEAYTALSMLYLYDVWDWSLTKEAFENALANNPNNEIAHAHFAWYHVLFDDMKESIYHAKMAVTLEPTSAAYATWLAWLYWVNKEYDQAESWARKSLTLKMDIPYGNLVLSWVYLQKKQYKQAVEYIEQLPTDNDYWKLLRGYIYVKAGQREKAMLYWNEMEEKSKNQWVNSCYRGMMASYLGFTDKAFEYLNDACEKKYYPISYINVYPCAEDIRQDPRYDKLLQKMNLPGKKAFITSNP
jgi:TolB-like protein/AraC-like DNA-binding protein/tetratricopeptide (TPR) repeat protein